MARKEREERKEDPDPDPNLICPHDTSDPFFDHDRLEVDEQSERKIESLQVE